MSHLQAFASQQKICICIFEKAFASWNKNLHLHLGRKHLHHEMEIHICIFEKSLCTIKQKFTICIFKEEHLHQEAGIDILQI